MKLGNRLEEGVWERKYHLALERMESDEREFRAVEEVLRRLALRLVALVSAPGAEVDALLERLTAELRGKPSPASIEPLLDALAGVVTRLDDASPAEGGEDSATIEALRADIARLQELLATVSTRLGDVTRFLAG
jgi:diguanylate cyclase